LADIEQVGEEEDDLFVQSIEVVEFLLRTKTAVGNLKRLFEKSDLRVQVALHVTPQYGDKQEMEVPFEYMLPESLIDSGKTVNLKEFKDRAASLDDRQKAKELSGKALVTQGSETRAGRQIHHYAFFAPTRPLYADISKKNGLLLGSGEDVQPLYEGGIYITTKGRPTGVELDPPSTGFAGYWPNIYMILNDDGIIFDVGRKAVPGRTRAMLKEVARGIFNSFLPFVTYSTTDPPAVAGTSATIQQYSKQQKFNEITELPDLGLPQIRYLKHPDGQEAAVVALFHELVGAGLLKGYRTLKTGLKETYDLWGRYQIDVSEIGINKRQLAGTADKIDLPIVIEFKFAAQSILADFQRDVKFFQDIDLIVCWDIAETTFAKYKVKAEPLSADDVFFFGSNYLLSWPGAYNLGAASEKPVLALRRFIEA
jgi:hypothetical protein